MKSILFTTTALVAFAGAAAAEVSFGGDASIGFNDKVKDGFYWSMGLTVTATQELNNGLEAGFTLDVDLDDDIDDGEAASTFSNGAITTSDFVLHLKSESWGLYYGDVAPAADQLWTSVKNLDADSFNDEGDNGEDGVLLIKGEYNGIEVGMSANVRSTNDGDTDGDDETAGNEIEAYQVAAKGDMGNFNWAVAYQDEDNKNGEIFGLTVGTSFSGADVKFSYAKESGSSTIAEVESIGIQLDYSFDPVDLTVFYVAQDTNAAGGIDDNFGVEVAYNNGAFDATVWYHGGNDEELGLEGSYDMGNGLKLFAGYIDNKNDVEDDTEAYVAAEYDLGGGASLLFSHAEVGDGYTDARDEVGSPEYNEGTTLSVSFKF